MIVYETFLQLPEGCIWNLKQELKSMKITLKDAADFVGGKIIGNSDIEITNLARIEDAKPTELSFLFRKTFLKFLETTKASALIVSPDIPTTREDISYIVVENANAALQKILTTFFKPGFSLNGIANSASIDDLAEIGENCSIGENVVIEKKCKIGKGTNIYHNTVIMNKVAIGDNCIIFPNVTIRENCIIGNNVIIHPGVVIGADGFGYTPDGNGSYNKIPQIGNVVLEDDVEIGANTCIDRAAMGSTIIRKGTKIDNLVQIAHNVEIGNSTAISAQTGISGSSKVGNYVILAGQVGLVDHIEIEDGTIVGAQAGVSKSIKKGRYFGTPAKEISHFSKLEAHMRNLPKYAEKIKSLEKMIKELEERLNK